MRFMEGEINLAKLRQFADELQGDQPKTPTQVVVDQMSKRLTNVSTDAPTVLRLGLFLSDVVLTVENAILDVAKGNEGKSDEELTEEVKATSGYEALTLGGIAVEDENVTGFIREAKIRLAEEYHSRREL